MDAVLQTGRGWLAFALALCFACPAGAVDSVLDRIRAVSSGRAGSVASLQLDAPLFSAMPLIGAYRAESDTQVRYRLANSELVVDLLQAGNQTSLQLSLNAFILTPDELTDTEYRRLRLLLGPLGTPLLSLRDLPAAVEREYQVVKKASDRNRLTMIPRQDFRETLRAWTSFQTGLPPQGSLLMAPETLVLKFPAGDTSVLEINEMTAGGESISKLVFRFGPPDASPVFQLPTNFPVIDNQLMMLAIGAGPQWLVGKSAPTAEVARLDGRKATLGQRKNRPMLINFWATWCGPCRIEWPVLQELYERYRKDVDFFMLSPEQASIVSHYIESSGFTAPVYVLPDESVAARFAVKAFPVTYFVNARGKIEKSFVGFPAAPNLDMTRAALRDKYDMIIRGMLAAAPKK